MSPSPTPTMIHMHFFRSYRPLFIAIALSTVAASCAAPPQGYERPADREYDVGAGAETDSDRVYTGRTRNRAPHLRGGEDHRPSKFSFQVIFSDQELDELELDFPGLTNSGELEDLDRRRLEMRFGFGPERARGRFFFFGESFGDDVTGDLGDASDDDLQIQSSDELDTFGIGGGMSGAPYIGPDPGDVDTPRLVLPFEWDLSVAYGDDDEGYEVGYAELRAAVGLGVEWLGLRPHAGVQLSGISGEFEDDDDAATIQGRLIDDTEFSGFNVGAYGEIRFAPPQTPLLLRLRYVTGDIEQFELGFGVSI